MSTDLRVSADASALAADVAALFVEDIRHALSDPQRTRPVEVAISGGFTTTAILPALLPYAQALDWALVRWWWVDERFVSAGSPDRNDADAIDRVLQHLPGTRWVPMPCDEGQGLNAARQQCAEKWAAVMGEHAVDVALVGMGSDGHIASLFPGGEWVSLGEDSPAVLAVEDSPKPPAQRLTLSMPVICAAERIILATGGESKREAMTRILQGASLAQWPAAALLSASIAPRTTVCIDEAAAPL